MFRNVAVTQCDDFQHAMQFSELHDQFSTYIDDITLHTKESFCIKMFVKYLTFCECYDRKSWIVSVLDTMFFH